MNKTTLLLAIMGIICSTANSALAENNPTITDAFKNGTPTIDTRVFYFNRSFDRPGVDDARAFTAGGIFKYETGAFHNFKVGLAYYGSHSLFGIVDRDKGGGTGLLQRNGDDIAFLGEAYVDYTGGPHQVKIGRQRLSTPLANDHDLRLLPSVYEAGVYRNTSLPNTLLEGGYIARYSGFVSRESGFDKFESRWGKDGLAYVYGTTKAGPVDLRGQYIGTLDDRGREKNYGYVDGKLPIEIGEKTYIQAQWGHTGYQDEDSGKMYGAKAGTTFGKLDFALVWNAIRDNQWLAVEAGPMYTDWQQGYGNYEPSDAFGGYVTFRPTEKSSIKVGYVDVDSKGGDAFNIDSFAEFNLDANYKFTDQARIRLRYSNKNQDKDSDREDRDDFRIIFYYNFF